MGENINLNIFVNPRFEIYPDQWLDILNERVTAYVYSVTFMLKRSDLLLTQVHIPLQLLRRVGRFKNLFPNLNNVSIPYLIPEICPVMRIVSRFPITQRKLLLCFSSLSAP
jgi:hypothetical protein